VFGLLTCSRIAQSTNNPPEKCRHELGFGLLTELPFFGEEVGGAIHVDETYFHDKTTNKRA